MRIEEETVRGFRTCARDRRAHGDCPGYVSEEIDVIRETITVTFGDLHGNTSDPYFPITSHTHERILPVSDADRECPHCGATASISLEPRHEFPRLSEHSPNELVRRSALERDRDQRAIDALSVEERQAIALEKLGAALARATQPKDDAEENKLRLALVEQAARMEQLTTLVERQASVIDELQPPRRPPGRPRKAESENGHADAPARKTP